MEGAFLKRSTKIWFGSATYVLATISAQHYGFKPSLTLLIAMFCLAFLVYLLALKILYLIILCLVVVLAFWRVQPWLESLTIGEDLIGETVVVQGRVVTDRLYEERGQSEFELDNLILIMTPGATTAIEQQRLKGKLRVSGYGLSSLLRHDIVRVEGKLKKGFGTRLGSISFAQIQIIGRSTSIIEKFRRQASAELLSSLSEQQAALVLGILVGQRSTLSEDSRSNLRIAGLTHIIAVSGYNLSIMVRLVRRNLKALSLKQSTLLSVLLLAGFISLAGNSASVIRAAWVISLSLITFYYGLNIKPLALLFLSAAFTVFFDPFYIWFDLGWWLSFLAFFGVLIIGPGLTQLFYPNSKPGFITQIIIETFSATLCTLPISAWAFGQVSVYSLLANMIVVPLVPMLMVAGTLVLFGRLIIGSMWLLDIFSYVSGLGLNIIFYVAQTVASFPYAQFQVNFNTWLMLASYLVIIALSWLLVKKTQLSRVSYNLLE